MLLLAQAGLLFQMSCKCNVVDLMNMINDQKTYETRVGLLAGGLCRDD